MDATPAIEEIFRVRGAVSLVRPCPLAHHAELGPWSKGQNFFEGVERLGMITGIVQAALARLPKTESRPFPLPSALDDFQRCWSG
jgi:hypothetical protein